MPSTLSTYFISYHMAIIYSVWFCWTTKRMTTKLKKGTHTKIQYHNPMRWNNSYCSLHVSNSSPTITIPLTNSSKFISFPSFFHPIQLELLFSLFCCFFFYFGFDRAHSFLYGTKMMHFYCKTHSPMNDRSIWNFK